MNIDPGDQPYCKGSPQAMTASTSQLSSSPSCTAHRKALAACGDPSTPTTIPACCSLTSVIRDASIIEPAPETILGSGRMGFDLMCDAGAPGDDDYAPFKP